MIGEPLRMIREAGQSLVLTYWFVPALMSAGGIALAIGTLYLDTQYYTALELPWVYINSAEGARAVLSTIANSVITVAGVSFSITIVALTVAASQYGPHVLSNLMRDRGNQVVLGTFTGTFLYCLMVLRTIHGTGTRFEFDLAIGAAVVLAIASIAVFIYFIHHISTMLRVETVVERIGNDFRGCIDLLYPEPIGEGAPERFDRKREVTQHTRAIYAAKRGYLLSIRPDELVQAAKQFGTVLILSRMPGDYLIPTEQLGHVTLEDPKELAEFEHAVNELIRTGHTRNSNQDVRYPAAQLMDIAMHALSPASNDLLTAQACIDEIAAALTSLLGRKYPDKYRVDSDGLLRVVADPVRFGTLAELTFGELLPHAAKHFVLARRVMDVIRTFAHASNGGTELSIVARLATDLASLAEKHLQRDVQRQAIVKIANDILLITKERRSDAA